MGFFELATHCFWHFIGMFAFVYFMGNLILQIIHKSIRAATIRKIGYPPSHCDGDGDAYKEDE